VTSGIFVGSFVRTRPSRDAAGLSRRFSRRAEFRIDTTSFDTRSLRDGDGAGFHGVPNTVGCSMLTVFRKRSGQSALPTSMEPCLLRFRNQTMTMRCIHRGLREPDRQPARPGRTIPSRHLVAVAPNKIVEFGRYGHQMSNDLCHALCPTRILAS
jgi:hypothetical protein